MSQVASLADVVQVNLAMPFCLSFKGVPYYERSQELCSFIDSVVSKQLPEVAGQYKESHHDVHLRVASSSGCTSCAIWFPHQGIISRN